VPPKKAVFSALQIPIIGEITMLAITACIVLRVFRARDVWTASLTRTMSPAVKLRTALKESSWKRGTRNVRTAKREGGNRRQGNHHVSAAPLACFNQRKACIRVITVR
jgi:hypothetical protein